LEGHFPKKDDGTPAPDGKTQSPEETQHEEKGKDGIGSGSVFP